MKLGRFTQHATFGVLILLGFSGAVATAAGTAVSSTGQNGSGQSAGTGNVQGYASDTVLQNGTVVQLSGGTNKVAPASAKDLQQMYGVTVDPHQLSLTISDASLQNEAYVATGGTYGVLVSNQNGPIKTGDYVTLSSVDGVGMRADTSQGTVLGRAAGSFDGKADATLGSMTLKASNGSSRSVQLGRIPVTIDIQRNPEVVSTTANLPKPLQRVGEAIADKPVGAFRIYLSIAVLALCILIAVVTLYAGIRNSIIAIGRNPLSQKAIFKGLLEVIATGLLIVIIGLFAVYLLLKL